MTDFLEMSVDKFTFRVAADRFYNAEGMWAKPEGKRIRVGLSDFLQQRSGDVAFVEVNDAGTQVFAGQEIAMVETIKVNLSLTSPVTGRLVEVNPTLETTPEAVNQDPYNAGWLAVIESDDWEADRSRLLDPQAYFRLIRTTAEEETRKP